MYVDPVAQSDSGIHVEEENGALQQHHYPYQDQRVGFFL